MHLLALFTTVLILSEATRRRIRVPDGSAGRIPLASAFERQNVLESTEELHRHARPTRNGSDFCPQEITAHVRHSPRFAPGCSGAVDRGVLRVRINHRRLERHTHGRRR